MKIPSEHNTTTTSSPVRVFFFCFLLFSSVSCFAFRERSAQTGRHVRPPVLVRNARIECSTVAAGRTGVVTGVTSVHVLGHFFPARVL